MFTQSGKKKDRPIWVTKMAVKRILAGLFVLMMALYGVIAIDAGIVNLRSTADPAETLSIREKVYADSQSGQLDPTQTGLAEHSAWTNVLIAQATSAKYGLGGSMYQAWIHYAKMPSNHKIALGLHSALGGTIMLFGALQFLPSFRRRHPRWHRYFGRLYVVLATLSMCLSMYYLAATPVAQIYDGFTFYVGLWFLAIGVLLSIALSMYYLLKRRDLGKHQGFMAISYGMLLTAPVLRYLWIGFGMTSPNLSQAEGNFGSTALLLPVSFLLGYVLFCLNRFEQPLRATAAPVKNTKVQTYWVVAFIAMLSVSVFYLFKYYIWHVGLAAFPNVGSYIPAAIVALDDAVVAQQPVLHGLLSLSVLTGLLLGIYWAYNSLLLQRLTAGGVYTAVALCGICSGVVTLTWGVQMGMPSAAYLSGGITLQLSGLMQLGFAIALLLARYRGWVTWANEWLLLLLVAMAGMSLFYAVLSLAVWLPIPINYYLDWSVYRLANYSITALILVGIVYSIYGSVTRERFSR